jgi:hypothetical protein
MWIEVLALYLYLTNIWLWVRYPKWYLGDDGVVLGLDEVFNEDADKGSLA